MANRGGSIRCPERVCNFAATPCDLLICVSGSATVTSKIIEAAWAQDYAFWNGISENQYRLSLLVFRRNSWIRPGQIRTEQPPTLLHRTQGDQTDASSGLRPGFQQ